ncbi:MAG TPA: BON domain-containing protein [Thermoanaerobaculia bacterium]|nr:BON domain-containing protein [Thermoanaerobaculia bacterium]
MNRTAPLPAPHQDILDELRWNAAIDAERIEVGTEGREVVLRGTVHTYAEKCLAERIVKRMRAPVRNEIEVRPTIGGYRSDMALQRVLSGVIESLALNAETLPSVTVNDGWVTIEGVLARAYQKRLVETAICGMAGIRGITNRIRVQPPPDAGRDVVAEFQRACRRRRLAIERVAITFRDGRLALRGEVLSPLERDELLETAWSSPCVCEVEDHLEVSRQ